MTGPLEGYKIVDRQKLNELDDETFLDWRKRGWLPVIYYHLQSGSNWSNIIHQAAARGLEREAQAADDGEQTE